MSYLIVPADGHSADFAAAILRQRAREICMGDVKTLNYPGERYDMLIHIKPVSGSVFTIRREATGQSLATDGLLEQAAEVAAWARHLLPQAIPSELLLVNQAYDHGVALHYGISSEQVLEGWAPLAAAT